MTRPSKPVLALCLFAVGFVSLACSRGDRFRTTLDTHGGMSMVVVGTPGCDLESARQVLADRISHYSLVEGVVSVDQDKVHIQLAGETIDHNLATLLIRTYTVELAKVLPQDPNDSTGRWLASREDFTARLRVSDPPAITGDDVVSAHLDSTDSLPQITVNLTDEAATTFEDLTSGMVGEKLAIIVDGEVVSAPTVQERIAGGQVRITGSDWVESAWLASALNSTELPCPLLVSELDVVLPTGDL